jgi:hypothetical protein
MGAMVRTPAALAIALLGSLAVACSADGEPSPSPTTSKPPIETVVDPADDVAQIIMNATYRPGEIVLDPVNLGQRNTRRTTITCRSDIDSLEIRTDHHPDGPRYEEMTIRYQDSLDLVCVSGGEGAVRTEIVLAPGFTPDDLDDGAEVMCQRPDDPSIGDDGTCLTMWSNDHFVVIFIYKIEAGP